MMLSQSFLSSIIMTINANADNAPKMEGQEIIAHSLPSDNNVDNDTQGLEDMAELPFGHDDAEDEDHGASNQTWGLFNKRNMMILLCIAAIVFLCVVTGLSSAALTDNNNSVVVESFNNGAPMASAKASKAPKGGSQCTPNTYPVGTEFLDSECSDGCGCCCNTGTSCPTGWTPICYTQTGGGVCSCDI